VALTDADIDTQRQTLSRFAINIWSSEPRDLRKLHLNVGVVSGAVGPCLVVFGLVHRYSVRFPVDPHLIPSSLPASCTTDCIRRPSNVTAKRP
jgi:hypothetical protein